MVNKRPDPVSEQPIGETAEFGPDVLQKTNVWWHTLAARVDAPVDETGSSYGDPGVNRQTVALFRHISVDQVNGTTDENPCVIE